MTYKTFNSLMGKLLKLKSGEEKLNDALKIFAPDFNFICFSEYEELVTRCLREAMDDKNDWIGYWLYEVDCGREAKKDSIKIHNKNVPIKTIKDLYNLLNIGSNENSKENKKIKVIA